MQLSFRGRVRRSVGSSSFSVNCVVFVMEPYITDCATSKIMQTLLASAHLLLFVPIFLSIWGHESTRYLLGSMQVLPTLIHPMRLHYHRPTCSRHVFRLYTRPNNQRNGKYRIEPLSAASFPGALEVIRNAFCQDEAVSIGCEVNKNPVAAEELLELCADAALDGVSLVAVAIDTGEVAAAAFNKIQVASTTEKPFFEIFAEERCTQPSSRSLIEYMADMDGRCNLFHKYKVDCSLEIMFLATLRPHRGKHLGTQLCRISIDLARKLKNGPVSNMTIQDLGPKYSKMAERFLPRVYPKICQAIWTGTGTQIIGKRLNFTVHLTVPYTEFVYNGKKFADRLGKEPAFCELAALPLY